MALQTQMFSGKGMFAVVRTMRCDDPSNGPAADRVAGFTAALDTSPVCRDPAGGGCGCVIDSILRKPGEHEHEATATEGCDTRVL